MREGLREDHIAAARQFLSHPRVKLLFCDHIALILDVFIDQQRSKTRRNFYLRRGFRTKKLLKHLRLYHVKYITVYGPPTSNFSSCQVMLTGLWFRIHFSN